LQDLTQEPSETSTAASPEPLGGYNHNLRYKGRVYHMQTEDTGPPNHRVDTHLFIKGMIIASERTGYAELLGQPGFREEALPRRMRDQHKALIRRLLRGELDQDIVARLGSLEERKTERRISSYRHQLEHAGRTYSVETRFFATVVTDVFWEQVLIYSERKDCRLVAPAGSPEIERRAQDQHKRLLLELRDGRYDERIVGLLGSLEPSRTQRDPGRLRALSAVVTSDFQIHPPTPETVGAYHHRVKHGDRLLDLRTRMIGGDPWLVVSEVFHEQRLLISESRAGEGDSEALRRGAQQLHKEMLRALKRGELKGLD